MEHATFRLVEECSGSGDLIQGADVLGRVQYRFDRYQGMMIGSGMPIPGLHRIRGSISTVSPDMVGADATLRLEDGRSIRITVVDRDGSILAEGHGPSRGCSCC
jgi:hypothetical protein